MPLNDEIQFGFIAPGVFFPFVHDEGGVGLGPIADGFKKSAKRLNADDLDTDLLLVFLGQLVDPAAEVKIIFFEVLRIFVEVPPISLSLQTHLVCHTYIVLSVKVRQGNERKYFYSNRLHFATKRNGKASRSLPVPLFSGIRLLPFPFRNRCSGSPPGYKSGNGGVGIFAQEDRQNDQQERDASSHPIPDGQVNG